MGHDMDVPTSPSLPPARRELVPFGQYEVTVLLGPSNEFLGVLQIAIKKDFLSQEQKLLAHDVHHVEDIYKDDT
jgi:hypothetical protein